MNIISGPVARAQRVILYGQEGVGKSTYVSRLPRVLFLDTEEGTHRLNVDRVPVRTLEDLRNAVSELLREARQGNRPYRVLALDTPDRLWDMCAADICAINHWDSIETPGYGKGLKMATEKFLALLEGFDRLVAAGINVVLVCHCKVERMSPPDLPEYTMYQPKVSAPGKQAEETKEKLKQWCDMLLFARFETVISRKDGKAVGGEVRRLIETRHTSHWEAKCRADLPDQLTMDNADVLAAALGLAADTPAGTPAAPAAPAQPAQQATQPAQPDQTASAASAPAQAAATAAAAPAASRQRGEGECFFFPEEEAVLIRFFLAKGKLQAGQGLADLAPNIKSALHARPMAALKQAQEWADKNGGEVAA